MPRKARNGVIYPYKTTTRKTLKDGRVKEYVTWKAKVDDKWMSASTYEKCNEKIKRALADRSAYGYVSDASVKLGDYARQWLEFKQHTVDPGTYRNYSSMVNIHLKPYWNRKLSGITASYARHVIDSMQTRDHDGNAIGRATVERRRLLYTTLRQIMRNAVADRIIPSNPLDSIEPPSARDVEKHERNAFTTEEMRRILKTASEMPVEKGAVFWWFLLTGMRNSEVCGATYDMLELAETPDAIPYGVYTVEWKLERLKYRHGCSDAPEVGGRWPCGEDAASKCPQRSFAVPDGFAMTHLVKSYHLTRPKSQMGRQVPLIPALAQVMLMYMEATKNVPNPYNLIFRRENGMPIDTSQLARMFRSLLVQAGIPNPGSRVLHETRHSTVTLLYDMGVDPGMIQAIIGHSSYQMSQHYRHIDVEQRVRAVSGMEDRLGLESMLWEAPQLGK